MSTETHGDVMMNTPEGIAFFQLLSMRGRLKIEIRTGMKASHGVSTLAACQRMGLTNKRTKRGALADLEAIIAQIQESRQEEAK